MARESSDREQLWNEHKYAIADVLVNLQSRLCMVHSYHCKNGRVALTWIGLS